MARKKTQTYDSKRTFNNKAYVKKQHFTPAKKKHKLRSARLWHFHVCAGGAGADRSQVFHSAFGSHMSASTKYEWANLVQIREIFRKLNSVR